ncbi:MAG: ParA family protein [Micromonosporaceae bacterium]|nr:ParA family protein [Micromonosporaceae bacterium]
MTVVSVLNYKGGVGKTTVAANLAGEIAYRGRTVLLIDMDPQASLTLSFYPADEFAKEFSDGGTLLHWFEAILHHQDPRPLREFVVTPPRVNERVQRGGGRLDLIPSHLGLIDIDLDLAAYVGGSRFDVSSSGYLWVHRLLADALEDPAFAEYDVVIIDCAPNFNMITRTAVVASDQILIPAKADYLSTLGIDYLRRKVAELVRDYNEVAGDKGGIAIAPELLGIVFTMIQHAADGPIIAARNYVTHTEQYGVPVFRQMIRESKTLFATAGERGIPAVLLPNANPNVQYELVELATEFLTRIAVESTK